MRVVIQRVNHSQVEVNGQVIGKIQRGLNLLVGIAATDTLAEINWMARKVLDLRLFADEKGRFAHSIVDIQGELLVVSQFTLYGDGRKGRRPSFDQAASGPIAEPLFNAFIMQLRQSHLTVETGQFGAMMKVLIENDGPVTLLLERDAESVDLSGTPSTDPS